jgi:hypothetical protein
MKEDLMQQHSTIPTRAIRYAVLLAAVIGFASGASAQQRFSSPDEAVAALLDGVKRSDRKAILTVLGPAGDDITSSGDAADDAATRARFLEAYETRHVLETEGDKAILHVGAEEFPFPIPIVREDGGWQFDTAAGREEILYRRIGRNELAAIQTMLAYVDAQDDFARMASEDRGVAEYAQRIVSTPGKADGLFWRPEDNGGKASPLGELFANASARGYRAGPQPAPYHGYFYRILTRQGPTAQGGAHDYVVRGKMIGGFGLMAYPADYGNSGVMTFMVNHRGDVFEKDLGPQTAQLVGGIGSFSPDHTWRKIDARTTQ